MLRLWRNSYLDETVFTRIAMLWNSIAIVIAQQLTLSYTMYFRLLIIMECEPVLVKINFVSLQQ